MESNLFDQLAISLGLGLLVGLQRQRTESTIGGIRMFPLSRRSERFAAGWHWRTAGG